MDRELMMDYMDMWAKSMRHDDHGLGYPKKSIMLSSGGGGYTTLDDMIEQADSEVIKTIDAAISSLDQEERNAVWARWLKTKKPMYYEIKLQNAINNLMQILSKRLGI